MPARMIAVQLSRGCGSILSVSERTTLEIYRSTGPAEIDLARESWLLDRAADGRVSMLLACWRGPVVVLGYGQRADDVNLDWCRAEGVTVLRRLTGGTGVIHRGDLGVGLFLPDSHDWAKGIVGLYGRFLDVIVPALQSLGSRVSRPAEPARASRVRSPICFLDQLSDTLMVDGRKAVGCAQTRRRGAVLIHAAILLGVDVELYARIFDVKVEDVRAGLAPAVPDADWRFIGDAISQGFAEALGLEIRRCSLEPLPDRYLDPYRTPRWSPVTRDGSPGDAE
jgi:lipoate-protein ligase A